MQQAEQHSFWNSGEPVNGTENLDKFKVNQYDFLSIGPNGQTN